MNFQSDNAAAACPEVIDAVVAANRATSAAYDGDPWSARLDDVFSDVFGAPCTVLPVSTGTAANALALSVLVPPFGAVAAYAEAHIHVDECGAPEFFTGGAKLLLCNGEHGKLSPDSVAAGLAGHRGDVHQVQLRALSLTQATECGTVYAPDELAALNAMARARGWRTHLDGARFANALESLDCHPGDISWRAGVDILSLGAIKNGGMTAEALVVFDATLVDELRLRRKRAGQMPSKGRFQAAQLLAYVETGAWRRNARAANAGAARIAAAMQSRLLHPVEANELFVQLGHGGADRLRAAGFTFYDWGAAGSGEARFVVAWDT
ncbi:MAG: threonine aldolase family protein, partial [Janthinobacterium lividum]